MSLYHQLFLLHSLLAIQMSCQISEKIVDLLIQVEPDSTHSEIHIKQAQELKDIINDFQIQNEKVKSQVLLNDIKIDTFLQKSIVKKYLSSFHVEMPTSQSLNHSFTGKK